MSAAIRSANVRFFSGSSPSISRFSSLPLPLLPLASSMSTSVSSAPPRGLDLDFLDSLPFIKTACSFVSATASGMCDDAPLDDAPLDNAIDFNSASSPICGFATSTIDPSAEAVSRSFENFGLTTFPNATVSSTPSSSAASIATCATGSPFPLPPSDAAHSTTRPLPLENLNT